VIVELPLWHGRFLKRRESLATFIALLRGINVGGSGLLSMKELADLCSGLGFAAARTYIQSGNVIFESNLSEAAVRSRLEKALAAKMGKNIDVMVRTSAEMRSILSENPFSGKEPAKVGVAFLCEPPPKDLRKNAVAPGGEQVKPGKREIYIYYPDGMGRSKLKLPLNGAATTVRNINTAAKLADSQTAASATPSGPSPDGRGLILAGDAVHANASRRCA
jgi:uncharacterized protein (DUF1697 family)